MIREMKATILDCIGLLLSCLGIALAEMNNDLGWAFLFTVLGFLSTSLTLVNYRKYCRRAKVY